MDAPPANGQSSGPSLNARPALARWYTSPGSGQRHSYAEESVTLDDTRRVPADAYHAVLPNDHAPFPAGQDRPTAYNPRMINPPFPASVPLPPPPSAYYAQNIAQMVPGNHSTLPQSENVVAHARAVLVVLATVNSFGAGISFSALTSATVRAQTDLAWSFSSFLLGVMTTIVWQAALIADFQGFTGRVYRSQQGILAAQAVGFTSGMAGSLFLSLSMTKNPLPGVQAAGYFAIAVLSALFSVSLVRLACTVLRRMRIDSATLTLFTQEGALPSIPRAAPYSVANPLDEVGGRQVAVAASNDSHTSSHTSSTPSLAAHPGDSPHIQRTQSPPIDHSPNPWPTRVLPGLASPIPRYDTISERGHELEGEPPESASERGRIGTVSFAITPPGADTSTMLPSNDAVHSHGGSSHADATAGVSLGNAIAFSHFCEDELAILSDTFARIS